MQCIAGDLLQVGRAANALCRSEMNHTRQMLQHACSSQHCATAVAIACKKGTGTHVRNRTACHVTPHVCHVFKSSVVLYTHETSAAGYLASHIY